MTAETAILEARLRQELQQLDKLSEEMKKALKPYQGKEIKNTDISIRTEIKAGDAGYITFLHGLIYKEEYNYSPSFEAYVAESTLINYIGLEHLTNKVSGHHSGEVMTVEEIEQEFAAEKAIIEDDAICIKVNKFWYRGVSNEDLYNGTRGVWRIDVQRANKFKLVFADHNKIIRGVFEVDYWKKCTVGDYNPAANKVLSEEDINTWAKYRGFFVGSIARQEYIDKYLNKNVSDLIDKVQYPTCYLYKNKTD